MSFPLFAYTDASFEHGNNTPSQIIQTAKEQGYESVCLIDKASSSAVVQFLKHCKNKEMNPIVGVTLDVSIPDRDAFKWAIDNQSTIKWFFSEFSLDIPPAPKAHGILQFLSESVLKCVSSKAAGRFNTLHKSFVEAIGEGFTHSADSFCEQHLKLIAKTLKKTNFKLQHGHWVFVARSRNGYKNLLRLISIPSIKKHDHIHGESDNDDYTLTITDINDLIEDVVVVDPMCTGSVLDVCHYYSQSISEISAVLSQWNAKSFPISHLGLSDTTRNDSFLNEMANCTGLSIVPFPKAHYAKEDEYEAYCIKVAVHKGALINDFTFDKPDPKYFVKSKSLINSEYEKKSSGLKSYQHDFWATFPFSDVELNQIRLPNYDMDIVEIVKYAFDMCAVEFSKLDNEEDAIIAFDKWLENDVPEGSSKLEFRQKRLNDFCLHKLSSEGLMKRLKDEFGDKHEDHLEEYQERHKTEYDVIESMGFSGYFLIEYDMVNYARSVGVPVGDGRGSAAGSLIVYCLEITDVDPIIYGLQFERFLNPERVSMPDIDVDFGEGGDYDRLSVLKYIAEKYQQEGTNLPSSSQIANINRYQLKSSLSVVRKAYGLSMHFDAYLKHLIALSEQELGISKPKSISWDELLDLDKIKNLMSLNPVLNKVINMAKSLTGKMSTYGVHAGGVVISPTVIPDYAAIMCDDKGNYFSQFDKDDIETAGLIKFDVLGLRTLSVISEAISQIEKNRQIVLDPRKIDKFDPKVFELISDRVLCDVFQLESGGMRDLVGNLQPQSIDEIAVLSALYRPGALDSGMVEEYIEVKHGKKDAKYDHPALEAVTKDTFGCIVYQEQVMSIVRELAGYSLGQADLLRRAMGKKKVEEMQKQKAIYGKSSQEYWKEHHVELGQKLGFKFELNIHLMDLKEELEMIGILQFLPDHGHFSTDETVVPMMCSLLRLNENDRQTLESRLSDFKYTLKLFKSHYQHAFEVACRTKLMGKVSEEKIDEVYKRLYYATSQFVRFNQIFNKVEKFAGYGFNKSHAIAYSVITYVTAYLKTHYPAEFYSAALSFKDRDLLQSTVIEATQKMGVKLLPPNINKSNVRFNVEGSIGVRYGLEKLRDVSNKASIIVSERANDGPYTSLYNFMARMMGKKGKPDSSALRSLSVAGAFDSFIPKRIIKEKDMNGRQYMIWMSSMITKSKTYKSGELHSVLHENVDGMSDYEFSIYLSLISGVLFMTKNQLLESDDVTKEHITSKVTMAKAKVTKESLHRAVQNILDADGVTDHCKMIELASNKTDTIIGRIVLAYLQGNANLTQFDMQYIQWFSIFFEDFHLTKNWHDYLLSQLNVPVTETLNAERHASGMYMTSTPIKVLNIAERVEREPPSSIIDGCPVPVGLIDDSYDDQQVTTFGIIRDVVVKTVKKETSNFFNEKMLFFKLESGADFVDCMIFGNKGVNAFYNKVIVDGGVILAAGKLASNDFGITLSVQAVKRYYPSEDEALQIVPTTK